MISFFLIGSLLFYFGILLIYDIIKLCHYHKKYCSDENNKRGVIYVIIFFADLFLLAIFMSYSKILNL